MKPLKSPTLYSRLTLITSVTIVVGYFVVYAAWTNLDLVQVQSGEKITSTLMQNILNKINDIGMRTDGIYNAGGNIGIGTVGPGYKLDISGDTSLRSASTFRLFNTNNSSQAAMSNGGIGNSRLDFYTTATPAMSIDGGGNVGIGTTSPRGKLDVLYGPNSGVVFGAVPAVIGQSSSEYPSFGYNLAFTSTQNQYNYINTDTAAAINMGNNGRMAFKVASSGSAGTVIPFIEAMSILNTGNIGIGTTTPGTYKLYVNGNAIGTSWATTSDRRFKKNITPIVSALDTIERLRGVTFDWKINEFKDRNFPKGKKIGFIAQEVERVLPEVVTTNTDGYKGVEYTNIVAVLVEAVKELNAKNLKLEKEIQELKSK